MRMVFLIPLGIAACALTTGAGPAHAAGATDHYPFCQLDSVTGATVCYFSTREQCGPRCISNPGYVGPEPGTAKRRAPRR